MSRLCGRRRSYLRAAQNPTKDVAEILIASKSPINAKDQLGQTPLHYAEIWGSTEVVEVYLAENGYYGDGDIEALVDKRLESLRNPSGKTFEDLKPDGRVFRIRRSGVSGGGTVTVMTDITEQKRAEQELLEAKRRTEEANKLVTEKNETLEALSSKLSKYLSPQIYNSIFSGEQNVEIASKRSVSADGILVPLSRR